MYEKCVGTVVGDFAAKQRFTAGVEVALQLLTVTAALLSSPVTSVQ